MKDRKQNMTNNNDSATRTLIIIGGHEDKESDKVILRELLRHTGDGRIVVTTVASHQPEGYFQSYEEAFGDLGMKELVELDIPDRLAAHDEEKLSLLEDAAAVFFTGGDQLKVASQLGCTPVFKRIRQIYQRGGVIAGTSAGASVMCETMLVKGRSKETHRIGDLHMAPGLGLIRDVIIDQHFAERGRIGRLLGAIAHNPEKLGIGIDEDTAIVVQDETHFKVVGSGGVYIADASEAVYSNIAEGGKDEALSLHDLRLHVLSHGDSCDLETRRPKPHK